MSNMFDKKLGRQLWERVQVFHGSSYISEQSLTEGDAEVMQEIHLEIQDAKEYLHVLETFAKTYQIPLPLRAPRGEPFDPDTTRDFADLAQRPEDAAGIDWRLCYAEDVPRLLAFIKKLVPDWKRIAREIMQNPALEFNPKQGTVVKSPLLEGKGVRRTRGKRS